MGSPKAGASAAAGAAVLHNNYIFFATIYGSYEFRITHRENNSSQLLLIKLWPQGRFYYL